MQYTEPEMEIKEFPCEDILCATTSGAVAW